MRRLLLLLFPMLLFALPSMAEDPLYPTLTDPVDQYMQSLSVMSQQDETIAMLRYDDGRVTEGGCRPVSIANSVIATFGVTEKETSVGIVEELIELMVNTRSHYKTVNIDRLPRLLDPQQRAEEQEKYPYLAQSVGAYSGSVTATLDVLNAEEVLSAISGLQRPAIHASRLSVHPSWENVLRILFALHDMGLDDATVCLAQADAGRNTSGSPLASGKYGHYLTVFIHVGAFMESGAMYVLDSLPRAIEGEIASADSILRNSYHFPTVSYLSEFNSTFAASRISPTVIKLVPRDEYLTQLQAASGEDAIALWKEYLESFMLFGRFPMIISLPG